MECMSDENLEAEASRVCKELENHAKKLFRKKKLSIGEIQTHTANFLEIHSFELNSIGNPRYSIIYYSPQRYLSGKIHTLGFSFFKNVVAQEQGFCDEGEVNVE